MHARSVLGGTDALKSTVLVFALMYHSSENCGGLVVGIGPSSGKFGKSRIREIRTLGEAICEGMSALRKRPVAYIRTLGGMRVDTIVKY